MTKVSAEQFRDALDWVRHATASLKSARKDEIAHEASILRDAVKNLDGMTLKRANDKLEGKRNDLADIALKLIDDRTIFEIV